CRFFLARTPGNRVPQRLDHYDGLTSTGLPPVLIQVASTEVLRIDAEQLAQRCAASGVPVTLQIWDRAFHVFQVAADLIPDARQAVDDIAAFIRERIGAEDVAAPEMRTPA
ncbi:alpha/beta hydrolase, partial [Mycobacteroides abscessus]